MSLARQHRNRILAARAAQAAGKGADLAGGVAPAPETSAYDQMRMKLAMDMRRLKEIQSIERKIDAKRNLIPEYVDWVEGVLAADADGARGVQDEILITMMIWLIDVGEFAQALRLVEYVLRWGLTLPERYSRTVATLVVEEIAGAALSRFAQGEAFPVDILDMLDLLTESEDMPDQVRAKLFKARGIELMPGADIEAVDEGAAGALRASREAALAAFQRARQLHDKCGVTKLIEQLERDLKKTAPPQNSGGQDAG